MIAARSLAKFLKKKRKIKLLKKFVIAARSLAKLLKKSKRKLLKKFVITARSLAEVLSAQQRSRSTCVSVKGLLGFQGHACFSLLNIKFDVH